jgi:Peptidase family S41
MRRILHRAARRCHLQIVSKRFSSTGRARSRRAGNSLSSMAYSVPMTSRVSRALLAAVLAAASLPARAEPPADATMYQPEAIRADLDALYRGLQDAHYDLFARRPRADYDRLYRETREKLVAPMTRLQLQTELQKFVAYGRVAHAHLEMPNAAYQAFRKAGGKVFPFSLRVIEGRFYIEKNHSGLAFFKPGAELVSLNGRPMGEWRARLSARISADTDYLADSLLEYWAPQLLWIELGEVAAFSLCLRGEERCATAPARTGEEIAAAKKETPPGLSVDFNQREARMLNPTLGYLRPAPFYNFEGGQEWDNAAFKRFIDSSFELLLKSGATRLLIDLRENPGGDNSFSDLMVAWFADKPFRFYSSFKLKASAATRKRMQERLTEYAGDHSNPGYRVSKQLMDAMAKVEDGAQVPLQIESTKPREGKRFTGKVYVLINRNSLSNTVAVAATIQDERFGTLIGEETSDLATSFGASEQFTLSRTGLLVTYPKSYFVRPSGDRSVRGVVPSRLIKTPVVETPDDPVLQAAIAIASE